MDLKAIVLLILTVHLGGSVSLMKRIRLRRVLMLYSKCDKGFYFDPNLEEKGRCQPCSEICGHQNPIGDDGECDRHKDQCQVVPGESTSAPLITSDSTSSPKAPNSVVVVVVAVTSIFFAVSMTTVLVCFIYKSRRCHHDDDDDDEVRSSSPRLIKPVESNSLHESKDKICVSKVNNDPLDPHQMALLQSHGTKEFPSSMQDEECRNGVTCSDHSIRYDATSGVQSMA